MSVLQWSVVVIFGLMLFVWSVIAIDRANQRAMALYDYGCPVVYVRESR